LVFEDKRHRTSVLLLFCTTFMQPSTNGWRDQPCMRLLFLIPYPYLHWKLLAYNQQNANVSLDVQKELALHQPDEPSSNSSGTRAPDTQSHAPLSTGAIVGISLAGTLIVTLAAALFFFIGRSRSLKQEIRRRDSTISPRPSSALYQHHLFLSPHGDIITSPSPSSRNSAAVFAPHDGYGRDAAAEYWYGAEGPPVRNGTASPGPDWRYGRTPTLA
jgi:hypothetical protein